MDQATERNISGSGVPRTIAVTGGTHGNERGGVWTVRDILADPARFAFPGLEVRGILSHPRAVERNLRYLDRDLNRCFGPELALARDSDGILDKACDVDWDLVIFDEAHTMERGLAPHRLERVQRPSALVA